MKAKRLQRTGMILICFISTAVTATPSVPTILRPPGVTPSLNPQPPYSISGRLSLITATLVPAGSACSGQGPYADIQAGAPITITDAGGRVIGLSHLGTGRPRLTGEGVPAGTCDFEFVVGGVPEVEVYSIRFERRGTLQYSLAEMKQYGWTVRLELRSD
jgi:hypothetical protein